jgi:hypothetical protein
MMARSHEEWRELYRNLKAVADDPEEEYGRRQRALAIIETIPREYRININEYLDDIDYNPDFDGKIV